MEEFLFKDENFNLWILLNHVNDLVEKAREKELRKKDISYREAAALLIIKAIGNGATPAKISRWLFREPHTISELISRMEKRGLVKKVKDMDRKNLVRVALTAKGERAFAQSTKRNAIENIIGRLPEEERKQLKSSLERLRDIALRQLRVSFKPPYP